MPEDYQSYLQEVIESFDTWFKCTEKKNAALISSELYPYTHLFSPIQINSEKIKNRIVMVPMGNLFMCDETGRPNQKMTAYFSERAKGGVGLITTGLVPVSYGIDPTADSGNHTGIMPRLAGQIGVALNAIYGENLAEDPRRKRFRDERIIAMTLDFMANLVRAGVDVFDVDLGCYDSSIRLRKKVCSS